MRVELPNEPGVRRRYALLSLLFAAAVVVLAACVPAEGERVQVETLTEPPSYYPRQTGIRWEYLPDNAELTDTRLYEQVAGPSVLRGEVWIRWDRVGRGIQESNYRQYSDEGVLLGRRLRPGSEIDFEPPIEEFPAPGSLRVGSQWGGNTVATLTFPEAPEEQRQTTFDLQYSYRVVDERSVTVQERRLEVFVIELTSRNYGPDGEIVEQLSQQVWFAPYVGVVKTEADHYLVASNIFDAPRAP